MLAPEHLDRLLDDCAKINARLSSGARRTLQQFLLLRERHGAETNRYLSADDVELLEDWAAAEYEVHDGQPMASEPRTATVDRRAGGCKKRDGASTAQAETVTRATMASRGSVSRPTGSGPPMDNSRAGKQSGTETPRRRPPRASSIA